MSTVKSTIIATAMFGLVAGFGTIVQPTSALAMDGDHKASEKMQKQAAENTPENVQRSAPSGNEFPGSGTGPGSRSDELTEMDEVEAKKNPADAEKLLKEKGISAESQKKKH